MSTDVVALHQQAIEDAAGFAHRALRAPLDGPTTCDGWDLRDLLAHMVGEHHGFAAAVRAGAGSTGGTVPRTAYTPVPPTAESWDRSTADLVDAFATADPNVQVTAVVLGDRPLPLPVVVTAQLLDSAVHAWDLARSLGEDHEPAPEIVSAALAMAERIPDDASREGPGAAFGHALPGGATPWERLLRLLGRDPQVWPGGGAAG